MTPRFAAYRSRTAATACATSRSRPIASWRSLPPQPTRRIRRSRSSSCKPNMSPSRAPSWQPGGGARPPSRRSGRPIMRSSKARRSASRRSRPTEPGFSAGGAGSGGRSRFWMAGVCPIRSARSSTRCSCCGSVSGCRRARLCTSHSGRLAHRPARTRWTWWTSITSRTPSYAHPRWPGLRRRCSCAISASMRLKQACFNASRAMCSLPTRRCVRRPTP